MGRIVRAAPGTYHGIELVDIQALPNIPPYADSPRRARAYRSVERDWSSTKERVGQHPFSMDGAACLVGRPPGCKRRV